MPGIGPSRTGRVSATTPLAGPDTLPYPENVEPGKPGIYLAKPDETCHKVALVPRLSDAAACCASPNVPLCPRLRLPMSAVRAHVRRRAHRAPSAPAHWLPSHARGPQRSAAVPRAHRRRPYACTRVGICKRSCASTQVTWRRGPLRAADSQDVWCGPRSLGADQQETLPDAALVLETQKRHVHRASAARHALDPHETDFQEQTRGQEEARLLGPGRPLCPPPGAFAVHRSESKAVACTDVWRAAWCEWVLCVRVRDGRISSRRTRHTTTSKASASRTTHSYLTPTGHTRLCAHCTPTRPCTAPPSPRTTRTGSPNSIPPSSCT